jgi:hypothetical protein
MDEIASRVCKTWHNVVDTDPLLMRHLTFDRFGLQWPQRQQLTAPQIISVIRRAGPRIRSITIAPHVTVLPYTEMELKDILVTLMNQGAPSIEHITLAPFFSAAWLERDSIEALITCAPISVSMDPMHWIMFGSNAMGGANAGLPASIRQLVNSLAAAPRPMGGINLLGFEGKGLCQVGGHGLVPSETNITTCRKCGILACHDCWMSWIRCAVCQSRLCQWRPSPQDCYRLCATCRTGTCRFP